MVKYEQVSQMKSDTMTLQWTCSLSVKDKMKKPIQSSTRTPESYLIGIQTFPGVAKIIWALIPIHKLILITVLQSQVSHRPVSTYYPEAHVRYSNLNKAKTVSKLQIQNNCLQLNVTSSNNGFRHYILVRKENGTTSHNMSALLKTAFGLYSRYHMGSIQRAKWNLLWLVGWFSRVFYNLWP